MSSSKHHNLDLVEATRAEFQACFPAPFTFFQSAAFNELNAPKCERLVYLIAHKRNKARLGMIAGIVDGVLRSPFSAPYGGPFPAATRYELEYVTAFPQVLAAFARDASLRGIELTLPPLLYDPDYLAELVNALTWHGYVPVVDLNYHFDLADMDDDYPRRIHQKARNQLKTSLNSGLRFLPARSREQKKVCYQLIRRNREEKGYPLHMTFEQVEATIALVEHECFLVTDRSDEPAAAGMCFRVTPEIGQIIFWGSLVAFNGLRPMNFLSYHVFEFLKHAGLTAVDVGPATEQGAPNFGLCHFKRNIGCRVTNKFTFSKAL